MYRDAYINIQRSSGAYSMSICWWPTQKKASFTFAFAYCWLMSWNVVLLSRYSSACSLLHVSSAKGQLLLQQLSSGSTISLFLCLLECIDSACKACKKIQFDFVYFLLTWLYSFSCESYVKAMITINKDKISISKCNTLCNTFISTLVSVQGGECMHQAGPGSVYAEGWPVLCACSRLPHRWLTGHPVRHLRPPADLWRGWGTAHILLQKNIVHIPDVGQNSSKSS